LSVSVTNMGTNIAVKTLNESVHNLVLWYSRTKCCGGKVEFFVASIDTHLPTIGQL